MDDVFYKYEENQYSELPLRKRRGIMGHRL